MYHRESDQEDFLVLAGEALAIVEGEERLLRQWDLVHCPAGTNHVIVGAGEQRCVVLAVGARDRSKSADWGAYTVDEAAQRHGAGVSRETTEPSEAYAEFPRSELTRYRTGWLPNRRLGASGGPARPPSCPRARRWSAPVFRNVPRRWTVRRLGPYRRRLRTVLADDARHLVAGPAREGVAPFMRVRRESRPGVRSAGEMEGRNDVPAEGARSPPEESGVAVPSSERHLDATRDHRLDQLAREAQLLRFGLGPYLEARCLGVEVEGQVEVGRSSGQQGYRKCIRSAWPQLELRERWCVLPAIPADRECGGALSTARAASDRVCSAALGRNGVCR